MRRGGMVIWECVRERWLYSLWSRAVCLVCRAYRAERSMTNTTQQVRAINYTQAWMREGWGDIEREEQRACYAQCHPQGKSTLDFKATAKHIYHKLNEVVSYHSCGRSKKGHPMPTDIDPYNHKVKEDTPAGCANRDTRVWGWWYEAKQRERQEHDGTCKMLGIKAWWYLRKQPQKTTSNCS